MPDPESSKRDCNLSQASHTMRLLNHVVDDRARENPGALYAELPLSPTSFEPGFRQVTYHDFANAINGIAWWLTRNLGVGNEFETLLYLGPNDMRHNVLLLGAVKAGYKMLFTSPRYSVTAQSSLVKSVGCRKILLPAVRMPVADEIIEACGLEVHQIPEMRDLLDQEYPNFPFDKDFERAKSEPLVVLHTSGTTGMPKPIIWTHDWASSFAYERILTPTPGFKHADSLLLGKRILNTFLCFHAGSLFFSIIMGIFNHTVTIYPLLDTAPMAAVAADCVKHTKVDAIVGGPPIIEDFGQNPHLLHEIRHSVETIFWAGGIVSTAAGEAIVQKVKLYNTCGSTEMGLWPSLRSEGKQPSDSWAYVRVHPTMNLQFEHRYDDLYESIIIRNMDPQYEQPVFKIFPHRVEYSSSDLFSPHPLDASLWRHRGRVDDMQVFITGEKYHPAGVEQQIARHPEVQAVLLVGTRRPQAALLLEMAPGTCLETSEQRAEAIERLWPTITESNELCPVYAKIIKSHVLFTSREKPMVRTAKGTIRRPATIESYEVELDAMFAKAKA